MGARMLVATNMSYGRPRCLLLSLLLLTGCQQQPAGAFDTLTEIRNACSAGDARACHQLDEASRQPPPHEVRLSAENRAAQVQRDVAAIIRGMRQTSASNGL